MLHNIVFFTVALAATCFTPLADAKVYIDISAPAAKRVSIAIPTLYPSEGEAAKVASKITEVIIHDLEISGIINILDKAIYPNDLSKAELASEKIDFKPWIPIGAEALLKGLATMEGGKVIVDARLYDVITGKQIMASKYKKDAREFRKMAHMISDDIIATLAGEKGPFSARIAFVSNVTGNKEIYTMDYDGEGIEALTRNGSINLSPAWAPDGSGISFVSYKDKRPAVYIKGFSTGKEARLSIPEGTSMGASWSPDGKRLAVVISKEGNADIYVINRDGSGFSRLTENWGLDLSPSWSPDGKEMAFVSDRGGSPQIYIMDSSGGNVRRLTFEGSYNTSPIWSPKGDKLAFSGMREGRFDIFIISADGSNLNQLTANSGSNENPSWSPDGRFIAFSSTRDGESNIYIMSSDGSGQRKITTKGKAASPNWGPRVKEK